MSQQAHKVALMERMAENYERHFVPAIGLPAAAALVRAADLRSGERVLDVACGTGVVTKLAAEHVGPDGTVAGLDPNPAMLAVARTSTPAGIATDWYEGRAEQLPFPDESFDVVLCGMGLQFFSDTEGGLREFHRVLVPGGRLVASVPGPAPPPLEIMADALARHIGPESAAFVHAVFSLHDPDALRTAATHAGFRTIDVRRGEVALDLPSPGEFLRQYVSSTPLAAAVGQADEARRAALEHEFSERCRPFAPGGKLAGGVQMTTLRAIREVSEAAPGAR